jgi:hypothetical protein
MKALKIKVDGNFNVLDEDQIAKIRAKMAKPKAKAKSATKPSAAKKAVETEALVERQSAAKAAAAAAEQAAAEQAAAAEPVAEPSAEAAEEAPAAPQKQRRVISARRSKEATTEGEEGEEAKPVLRKRRVVGEVEPEPAAADAPPVDEAAAAELAAEPAPGESEVVAEPETVEVPATEAPEVAAKAAAPVEAEKEPLRLDRSVGKDSEGDGRPEEKSNWRDVKRGERKSQLGSKRDEWVRPPKRRGDRRGGRAPKVRRDSDQIHVFGPRKKAIRIGQAVTVSELASAIGVKGGAIIKKLFE